MTITNALHGVVPRQTLNETELKAIGDLATLCRQQENLYLNINEELLSTRNGRYTDDFLYYHEGELVGYFAQFSHSPDTLEATGMVHPEYRRRGIGRALLEHAQVKMKERGIRKIILISDYNSTSGQAFLHAIGAAYAFSEYRMDLEAPREVHIASPELHVQPATSEELPAFALAMSLAFEGTEQEEPTCREALETWFHDPMRRLYSIKLGDRVIGGLSVFMPDEQTGFFHAFCVHPDHQGRGYGRQVLSDMIQQMLAEQRSQIALEVETDNKNALGLYLSCGFQETTAYEYYEYQLS